MNEDRCAPLLFVVNEKANTYIRENMIKAPSDMTYITSNLIGSLLRVVFIL